MSGLTIACVLRSGGDFTPEWVWALKRGLNRHLDLPYRSPLQDLEPRTWTLRCLSDLDLGPCTIPLLHKWPGWWSKIECFRPGVFGGRVLYLDLDTLPVGDLSELAAYDRAFTMLASFYAAERGHKQGESGVMAWTPGPHTEAIYEAYAGHPTFRGGDGPFIRSHVEHEYLQDLYPGQLVSLKVHAKDGPPEGARLVCGHGRPRLSDPRAGWAHDAWRDLAAA